ncbi:HAMP domain-containing methyl-accepting chemotaxis protein [Pseudoalteromonas maricaloris]
MLTKLRLSQQLSVSFGIMIVLMVVLSSFAYVGINSGYDSFVEYRNLARGSNIASELETGLLATRINVLNFLKGQSKEELNQFEKRIVTLKSQLDEASQSLTTAQSLRLIESSQNALATYESTFRKILTLYDRRNEIVLGTLDKAGPEMRKKVTRLIEINSSNGDFARLLVAAQLQEKLLLGRLYVSKFLVSNALMDHQRAIEEFQNEKRLIDEIKDSSSGTEVSQLIVQLQDLSQGYVLGIDEVKQIIIERNQLINDVLNVNGQQIAENLEAVKALIKTRQDELGPIVQARNNSTLTTISVVVVIVVGIGIFFSWYITRLIKIPIGGEPKEIAEVASRIASGDLTIQFDRGESVSGIYLAMRDMADKLKAIIAEIQSSTHALSSSSETLSAITAQSKQGADNQMEQLSHSAVSMNEMAATIAEITQSAQLAADAATDADSQSNSGVQVVVETQQAMEGLVGKIENVSKTIENLEQETESVGSILDVIRGIAEQTNLLALNAAIEAARAGEQGRGFAVVADEVRSLASRTQKSTDEIQEMISKLQNEAKRSVGMMRENVKDAKDTADKSAKTDEVLQAISSSVSTIKDMNLQIASASEEQNTVTQQLSQSVTEISETAQETATGAERASDEALSLLSLSRALDKSVSSFRL